MAYAPKPYAREADETVKCPACGKYNDDDARFCDQCGIKLVGRDDISLSVLDAAERKALPSSDFVFPGKRAYPIHDLAHARDALARSSGKPEAAIVRAAVYRKFPGLRKSK